MSPFGAQSAKTVPALVVRVESEFRTLSWSAPGTVIGCTPALKTGVLRSSHPSPRSRPGQSILGQQPVHGLIVVNHSVDRKVDQGVSATRGSVDRAGQTAGLDQLIIGLSEEAMLPVPDQLAQRASRPRDHRGASCEGFDEDQAEGLVPGDGK